MYSPKVIEASGLNIAERVNEFLGINLVYFKGFREFPGQTYLVGHFCYTGVATFRSGRKQRVYYYESVTIPTCDSLSIAKNVLDAAHDIQHTLRWAEHGVLRNWLNKHAFRTGRPHHRCVLSVRWDYWLGVDYNQDKLENVQP